MFCSCRSIIGVNFKFWVYIFTFLDIFSRSVYKKAGLSTLFPFDLGVSHSMVRIVLSIKATGLEL